MTGVLYSYVSRKECKTHIFPINNLLSSRRTPNATPNAESSKQITITMRFLSPFYFITVMAWIAEACDALSSSSGSASKHTLYDVPISNNGVKKKSHRVAVLS
jgi:hypothetical protein